jgi:hypothetical protein
MIELLVVGWELQGGGKHGSTRHESCYRCKPIMCGVGAGGTTGRKCNSPIYGSVTGHWLPAAHVEVQA